jgi:hypothetical protein
MVRLAMVVVAGLVFAFCASASMIPELQSGPVSLGGGNFLYVYQTTLSDLERLDPTATNGVTCASTTLPVTLVQCNPGGTFFTIYDVGGLNMADTMAASLPSGWGVSFNSVGLTPSTLTGSVPDNPAIFNVTFTYTGPVVQGPVTITGFDVISTDNGLGLGFYSSQATEKSNGLTHQEDSFIDVPAGPATPTPEPASLVLFGTGLLSLGAAARRKLRP